MKNSTLIVKPILQPEKTDSGILLPFQKPRNYSEALVVKKEETETEINVGDKIIYANNSHSKIQYNGELCHLIKHENVLLTIKK